jgi:oligopeptide transport system ATP-binding protein
MRKEVRQKMNKPNTKLAKLQQSRNIVNLVACELCCILVALIIDTLVFFDEFNKVSTPIIIAIVLAIVWVAAFVARRILATRLTDQINVITGVKKYKDVKTGEVLLKVENLSQHFGPLKAVDNVSFEVKKGEVFGLVGESGCGKTTTGRTVIKLYNPTGGNVYFKGQRIGAGTLTYRKAIVEARKQAKEQINVLNADSKANAANKSANDKAIQEIKANLSSVVKENRALIKSAKHDNDHAERDLVTQIQMIFQDPIASLDPRMTVRDIIAEGLIIRGMKDKAKIDEMVYNVLETVGLVREHAERYPHEFSGGQRQRIGVARAVVMSPEMIIADEPVSALDVSVQAQVINLLNDLKESLGLTILFIAHDLSVVKYFSDRIGVMYFGKMVELADADELFKNPMHPYTRSLLSAIPLPDPKTEKARQRIKYNPIESHDYSVDAPSFREIAPGHFVMCNDKEEAEYKANYIN